MFAFLIKLFLKKFVSKHFSQNVCVFDQTFFEKVCEQAFFSKGLRHFFQNSGVKSRITV
jgi:hypothetical protein